MNTWIIDLPTTKIESEGTTFQHRYETVIHFFYIKWRLICNKITKSILFNWPEKNRFFFIICSLFSSSFSNFIPQICTMLHRNAERFKSRALAFFTVCLDQIPIFHLEFIIMTSFTFSIHKSSRKNIFWVF